MDSIAVHRPDVDPPHVDSTLLSTLAPPVENKDQSSLLAATHTMTQTRSRHHAMMPELSTLAQVATSRSTHDQRFAALLYQLCALWQEVNEPIATTAAAPDMSPSPQAAQKSGGGLCAVSCTPLPSTVEAEHAGLSSSSDGRMVERAPSPGRSGPIDATQTEKQPVALLSTCNVETERLTARKRRVCLPPLAPTTLLLAPEPESNPADGSEQSGQPHASETDLGPDAKRRKRGRPRGSKNKKTHSVVLHPLSALEGCHIEEALRVAATSVACMPPSTFSPLLCSPSEGHAVSLHSPPDHHDAQQLRGTLTAT